MVYKLIFSTLIVAYSLFLLFFPGKATSHDLYVWGMIGWVQFFLTIYSWIKSGNRLISPYVIFIICCFIFNFGQALLYPFGYDFKFPILYNIKPTSIFRSEVYTLLMFAGFHLGALFYNSKKTSFRVKVDYNKKKIIRIGWVIFVVSVVPYFYDLISNIILSMTFGYGALYEQEAKTGLASIMSFVGTFFIPSCICLYVGYRDRHSKQMIIEFILLFIVVGTFLVGGRTGGVIILGMLLVLRNYLYKPITKKGLLIVVVAGFGLLGVLSTIAKVRGSTDRSLESYEMSGNSSDGAADAIREMGGSMSCLIKTQDFVPATEDYRYGTTYLYALTSIIPNFGQWEIHPAKNGANMSHWLTNKMRLNYGTGFSITAEAYINFGYFSWVAMLLLGYLFAWCFKMIEIGVKCNNGPVIIFSLIIFFFGLTLPRNNFINIVRPMVFYALPIYYLCKSKVYKKTPKRID